MMASTSGLLKRFWIHVLTHLRDRDLVISSVLSIVFLNISLYISYLASIYATKNASNFVTDIILSNIPVFNVDFVFMYGPFIMWIVVAIILLRYPRFLPFTVKSICLFIIIRAVFVMLTHIGPFPGHLAVDQESLVSFFTSDSDFFFSAHTGQPFLMALVFWHFKKLRYLFLVTSVFFGIIVLLAHVHYTIDVAGAFFMTYSIYRLAQLAFDKDWKASLKAGQDVNNMA